MLDGDQQCPHGKQVQRQGLTGQSATVQDKMMDLNILQTGVQASYDKASFTDWSQVSQVRRHEHVDPLLLDLWLSCASPKYRMLDSIV